MRWANNSRTRSPTEQAKRNFMLFKSNSHRTVLHVTHFFFTSYRTIHAHTNKTHFMQTVQTSLVLSVPIASEPSTASRTPLFLPIDSCICAWTQIAQNERIRSYEFRRTFPFNRKKNVRRRTARATPREREQHIKGTFMHLLVNDLIVLQLLWFCDCVADLARGHQSPANERPHRKSNTG